MAFEAYRVRKRFQWRGWEFAPRGQCDCDCGKSVNVPDTLAADGRTTIPGYVAPGPVPDCTHEVGTTCKCRESNCHCSCGIPRATYGGDIWLVEEGHPRKDIMLANRFAIGDPSIPPTDELLKMPQFKRLLVPPGQEVYQAAKEEKELVSAGRPVGRPRKE